MQEHDDVILPPQGRRGDKRGATDMRWMPRDVVEKEYLPSRDDNLIYTPILGGPRKIARRCTDTDGNILEEKIIEKSFNKIQGSDFNSQMESANQALKKLSEKITKEFLPEILQILQGL